MQPICRDNLKEGADEAAGAVAAEIAPPEPQAAETGEEGAAKGPVITLEVPPKTTGENDLQQVILDVLSGSGEAMTLAEIARKTGKNHFASLSLTMAGRAPCDGGAEDAGVLLSQPWSYTATR